jgi:sugar-specific transcriptional regulator TrmB
LTQEKVLKTLQNTGLSEAEAKVYVFLGKKGPQKAKDICEALKMPKQKFYVIIKNLSSKGILDATLEKPARFSAMPFEKVLDLFVKEKMEEAQQIQQKKTEVLSDWQSIAAAERSDRPTKFTVLEGRNCIYSKLKQMIEETKNQLSLVSTIAGLTRADQFGLLEAATRHGSKSKAQFRFITELSNQNAKAMKNLLERNSKTGFNFKGKTPNLGIKLFTRMVIKDIDEAVFFIDPRTVRTDKKLDDAGLWTNCTSLVDSFTAVFEELWRNSTDLEMKIAEIESGEHPPETNVISNAETAYRKYHEALSSAKEELVIFTSSTGLVACWQGMNLMRELAQRGVSIKIMAPITSENTEAAHQLQNYCEIRQGPAGYLGLTFVDGKQLFQFKNPPSEEEPARAIPYFENTFYTNDLDYVEKSRNMINNAWNKASNVRY